MEKKISIAVKILGWLIIVSHAIFLYHVFPFISSMLRLPILPFLVTKISWSVVLAPIEAFMFGGMLLMNIANPILAIIGIACGIGLLKYRNIARIYIIVMSWIRIVTGLLLALYFMKSAPHLHKSVIAFLPYWLPYIVFILFLTRSKVKKQFK